jgi:hypothetical protein
MKKLTIVKLRSNIEAMMNKNIMKWIIKVWQLNLQRTNVKRITLNKKMSLFNKKAIIFNSKFMNHRVILLLLKHYKYIR